MAPLRVLVVGCGNMGRSHARAYHQLDGYELVGLVARRPETREALSEELGGVATFADFEAAYRDYAQRREGLVELAHNDGWTPVVWPPEDAGDADAEPVEVIAKSEGDRPSRRVA